MNFKLMIALLSCFGMIGICHAEVAPLSPGETVVQEQDCPDCITSEVIVIEETVTEQPAATAGSSASVTGIPRAVKDRTFRNSRRPFAGFAPRLVVKSLSNARENINHRLKKKSCRGNRFAKWRLNRRQRLGRA